MVPGKFDSKHLALRIAGKVEGRFSASRHTMKLCNFRHPHTITKMSKGEKLGWRQFLSTNSMLETMKLYSLSSEGKSLRILYTVKMFFK